MGARETVGAFADRVDNVIDTRLDLSLERQEALAGWMFVSLKLAIIGLVIGFPIVFGVYVSFTDSSLMNLPGEFIGLDNYIWLFSYGVWWRAILNVMIIGLVLIPTNIIFSFTTALLIMERIRGHRFYQVAFIIPVAGPPLIWAIVWRIMAFPTEGGVINSTLIYVGIIQEAIPFTTSSSLALPTVILSLLWGFGLSMLIYISALNGVPDSLIDASRIDGASRFQRVRYVIWPLMKPVTFFLLVIQTVLLFQMGFAAVFVLTGGGPASASMVPSYFIYTLAFSYQEFGRASAAAMVLFVLTALISLGLYKLLASKVEYYQ